MTKKTPSLRQKQAQFVINDELQDRTEWFSMFKNVPMADGFYEYVFTNHRFAPDYTVEIAYESVGEPAPKVKWVGNTWYFANGETFTPSNSSPEGFRPFPGMWFRGIKKEHGL